MKGWPVIEKGWTTLDITKRSMASATYDFEGLWNFEIVDHAELTTNGCFSGVSNGLRFLCYNTCHMSDIHVSTAPLSLSLFLFALLLGFVYTHAIEKDRGSLDDF